MLTDQQGNINEIYSYDAFGNTYVGKYNRINEYGYNGKRYDQAVGLYDYGFRDYMPQIGRWTTIDPIRDGHNWYAYCYNDPVNLVDLWGLKKKHDYSEPPDEIKMGGHRAVELWGKAWENATIAKGELIKEWEQSFLSNIPLLNIICYPTEIKMRDSLPAMMVEFGKLLEQENIGKIGVMLGPVTAYDLIASNIINQIDFQDLYWVATNVALITEGWEKLDSNLLFESLISKLDLEVLSKQGYAEKEKAIDDLMDKYLATIAYLNTNHPLYKANVMRLNNDPKLQAKYEKLLAIWKAHLKAKYKDSVKGKGCNDKKNGGKGDDGAGGGGGGGIANSPQQWRNKYLGEDKPGF